ncbi:LuxR C-terminal-related transcriptional regulator [Kutzneria sp. 744]|uniref:ATP-binding protein n=1 Tax=Kutzneria sp. (strain 744) TaxID=345341 RepID=UPI0004AEA314|nr:LuxR C-terminal-related transcriptional regulator [Kutzneria sp. 744]
MADTRSSKAEAASALPAARSPLVGRADLINAVIADLAAAVLVTLDGVGGVGKTSVALAVAREMAAAMSVTVVELKPHRDPDLVAAAVATTLGLHDNDERTILSTLVEWLRTKRMLLVLDNCEHLIDGVAAFVDAILDGAPGVRILATSREALRVEGERIRPVPPLPVPPEGQHQSARHVRDLAYDSVQLLVTRAADVGLLDFGDTADPELVSLLVRRLGGIPLAIVLAAGRLRGMGLRDMLESSRGLLAVLDRSGRDSTDGHQTLRDCIAWSESLCSPAGRDLWMRLSVFAGDFDIQAAEAVCADRDSNGLIGAESIVDVLDSLVWASVVTREQTVDGQARYRLLDPIRDYGLTLLQTSTPDGDTQWHERHAEFFCRVATEVAAKRFSPCDSLVVDTVRHHMPDFRVAVTWCLSHIHLTDMAISLLAALSQATTWFTAASVAEGQRYLIRALGMPDARPSIQRMVVFTHTVWHAMLQNDPAAEDWANRCQHAAKETAESEPRHAVTAHALADFAEGVHLLFGKEDARAIDVLGNAVAALRSGEMPTYFHLSTLYLAQAGMKFDDLAVADRASQECLVHAEAHAAGHSLSWARWVRGLVELEIGEAAKARERFEQALRVQRDLGTYWGTEFMVETLARCAAVAREHLRAAQLLGAASKLSTVAGADNSGPSFPAPHTTTENLIREHLGAEQYRSAYHAGASLTFDDAVALALGEQSTSVLSDRQFEVARLVAQGLTNEAIAKELHIAESTVHTHVRDVLRKLKVSNRAGIAAWFTRYAANP